VANHCSAGRSPGPPPVTSYLPTPEIHFHSGFGPGTGLRCRRLRLARTCLTSTASGRLLLPALLFARPPIGSQNGFGTDINHLRSPPSSSRPAPLILKAALTLIKSDTLDPQPFSTNLTALFGKGFCGIDSKSTPIPARTPYAPIGAKN